MKHLYNTVGSFGHKLYEMAQIGKIGGLYVLIFSDEGMVPHFHISDKPNPKESNFSSAVKIQIPEYFPHGGHYEDKLSSKQKKQLMKFLNTIDTGLSNWEFLLRTWNKNNSCNKVNLYTELPDYTTL